MSVDRALPMRCRHERTSARVRSHLQIELRQLVLVERRGQDVQRRPLLPEGDAEIAGPRQHRVELLHGAGALPGDGDAGARQDLERHEPVLPIDVHEQRRDLSRRVALPHGDEAHLVVPLKSGRRRQAVPLSQLAQPGIALGRIRRELAAVGVERMVRGRGVTRRQGDRIGRAHPDRREGEPDGDQRGGRGGRQDARPHSAGTSPANGPSASDALDCGLELGGCGWAGNLGAKPPGELLLGPELRGAVLTTRDMLSQPPLFGWLEVAAQESRNEARFTAAVQLWTPWERNRTIVREARGAPGTSATSPCRPAAAAPRQLPPISMARRRRARPPSDGSRATRRGPARCRRGPAKRACRAPRRRRAASPAPRPASSILRRPWQRGLHGLRGVDVRCIQCSVYAPATRACCFLDETARSPVERADRSPGRGLARPPPSRRARSPGDRCRRARRAPLPPPSLRAPRPRAQSIVPARCIPGYVAPGGNVPPRTAGTFRATSASDARQDPRGGPMKTSHALGAIAATFAGILACGGSSGTSNTFVAQLNGANETPQPISTSATGTATFTRNGGTVTYNVSATGLSSNANNAHIHIGPPGQTGSV